MSLKKIVSFLLVLLMLVPLAACGGNDEPAVSSPSENQSGEIVSSEEPVSSEDPSEQSSEEVPSTVTVSTKDFLEEMKNNLYQTNKVTTDPVGLSDSTIVGVNQDRFENEVLYPVPADSEFGDRIYKVEDYGISTGADTNTRALNKLISDLENVEGLKKIVFTPGVYKFHSTIEVSGVKDLYICSSSDTENFEILMTGWIQGIRVTESSNIHFNGFCLDYAISPTVAGTVVTSDRTNKTITIKIDDEFDLNQTLYNFGKSFEIVPEIIQFMTDPVTGKLVPDPHGVIRCGSGEIERATSYNIKKRELTVTLKDSFAAIDPGTWMCVTYTMYEHFGMTANGCGDVYLEGCTIYCCPGMAFGASGTSGVYLNHFKLDQREGSTRLMTASADGLHTCDVGVVKVTNSIFQYSHDDSFNVKNTYFTVKAVVNKKITIQATGYTVDVGDVLEIFEDEYFRRLGRYTVTKVGTAGSSLELTVDKAVDEAAVGCLLADVTKATKLTLDNNIIGNKRNRGILLQTRESVVTNNVFHNIVHGAILIYTIRDYFKEGICPANVTVQNNKFINNYHPDVNIFTYGTVGTTVGLLEGIDVINNFMCGTSKMSVSEFGMSNSKTTNNLFYDICLDTPTSDSYAVNVSKAKDCVVKDNYVYSYKRINAVSVAQGLENVENKNNRLIILKDN